MPRRSATRPGTESGPGRAQRFAAGTLACLLATAPQIGLAAPALDGDHTEVQLETVDTLTIISARDGSVGNYSTFDIGAEEKVDVQIEDAGRHIARISGLQTQIDGELISNGHVYLLNPAGIMFGQGARVNVAGLHAAAGNIDVEAGHFGTTEGTFGTEPGENCEAGCDRYTDIQGTVTNLGVINARVVNLIGRFVSNDGTIAKRPEDMQGMFALVAGDDVLIGRKNDDLLVRIEGAGSDILDMFDDNEYRVTTTDVIDAGAEGRVFLGAGDLHGMAIHHASSAHTIAAEVQLSAGAIDDAGGDGDVLVEGEVDAARIRVETPGELDVETNLTAAESIDLAAGVDDGVGLLTIANREIASRSISLVAGDGFSGAAPGRRGNARVVLGGSTFRHPDDPDAAPDSFSLRQDRTLTDFLIPEADVFGGSVAGMEYRLESSDGAIEVEDGSKFEGSALTLVSTAESRIDDSLELESLVVDGLAAMRAASVSATGDISFNSFVTLDRTMTESDVDADQLLQAGGQLTFENPVRKTTTGTLTLSGVSPTDPLSLPGGIRIGSSVSVGFEVGQTSTGGTLMLDADEVVLFGEVPDDPAFDQLLEALTEFEVTIGNLPEFGRAGAIEATGVIRKETPGDLTIETESLRAQDVSVSEGELLVTSRRGLVVESDLTVLAPEERLRAHAGVGVSGDLEFSGVGGPTLTGASIELNARPGDNSNVGGEGISRVVLGDTRFVGVDADGVVGGNPESVRIHQDARISGTDLPRQDRWAEGSVAGVALELESNGGTRTVQIPVRDEDGNDAGTMDQEVVTVGAIELDAVAAARVQGSDLLAEAEVITVGADLSGVGIDLRSENNLNLRSRTLSARSLNLSAGNGGGASEVQFNELTRFQGQDAENPLVSFALRQDKKIAFGDLPPEGTFPDGGASLESFSLESFAQSIDVTQELADEISGEERAISLRAAKSIWIRGDLMARELEAVAMTAGSTDVTDPETGELVDVGLLIETRGLDPDGEEGPLEGELLTTTLSADVMSLRAGDRLAGVGDGDGNERVTFGDVVLKGTAADSERPDAFTLRQDATLRATDLPGSSDNVRFAGSVADMKYELRSDAANVLINEDTSVDGTALTVSGVFVSFERDALELRSLDVTATQTTIRGDVLADGSTVDEDGNPEGNVIVSGRAVLDGVADVQSIVSEHGDVQFTDLLTRQPDDAVDPPLRGISIDAARDVSLVEVVTQGDPGDAGGDVSVMAGGDIVVTDRILASSVFDPTAGTAPDGGNVRLVGANVSVQRINTISGEAPAEGGEVANGGIAGDIEIFAGDIKTLAPDGTITLARSLVAVTAAGTGDMSADGDITLEGNIELDPASGLLDRDFDGRPELDLTGRNIRLLGDLSPARDLVPDPDDPDAEIEQNVPVELRAFATEEFEASGDLFAGDLRLRAGLGGTGDLRLSGTGQRLGATSILLSAGDGLEPGATARVQLGDARFFGEDGDETSPVQFLLRQDASVEGDDLPTSERFGDGVAGITYEISSFNGTIDIADPEQLRDTDLVLGAAADAEEGRSSIQVAAGPLAVNSLLANGGMDVQGDLTVETVVGASGDLFVEGDASFGDDVLIDTGELAVRGHVTAGANLVVENGVQIDDGIALTSDTAQLLQAGNGGITIAGSGLEKASDDLTVLTAAGLVLDDDADIDVQGGSLILIGDYSAHSVAATDDLLLVGQGTLHEVGDTVLVSSGDLTSLGIIKTEAGDLILGAVGAMELSGDMTTANDWIAQKSFTSAADLNVRAGETARFQGDVDSTAGIDVIAGDRILFDGPQEAGQTITGGSIELAVEQFGPLEPAIVSDGPLSVVATDGDVRIASGNKIGVPGDVLIRATHTARLSDVNAAAIDVVASYIELDGRPPGPSLDIDGNPVFDSGVDMVANRIFFSAVPTLVGGGQMTFGTPTATEVSEQLARTGAVRAISPDLRSIRPDQALADLTPLGPALFDAARQSSVEMADTANATSETIVMVRAQANTVASEARPLWANEVLAFLDADLLDEPPAERGERDARLESAAILDTAHLYDTLFRPQHLRDSAGERIYESRTPRIREALDRAVTAYRAAHGDLAPDGAGLLGFVEEDDEQFEALDYLQRTAALIRGVRRLEMERAETQVVEDTLLGRLETDSLSSQELRAALEELLERPSASAPSAPSPAGS